MVVLGISLLSGWLPVSMEAAAAVALVAAVIRRDRRWATRRLPFIAGAALVLALGAAAASRPLFGITDPLPLSVWVWLGMAAAALLVVTIGWPSARWWQSVSGVVALGLACLVCGNSVNQFVGYYPTLESAMAALRGRPPAGQITLQQLHGSRLPDAAQTGELVSVDIPSSAATFSPRRELVYLPPVWFRHGHRPLPAVEMIGAEHAAPENWVRIGGAVRASNAYAAHHQGRAPILVFVDATESFNNDTECVNGPHGTAEDYLVKDVPRFVIATFGASRDPRHWGVLGFSMGGTCAIGLTVEHPQTFGHFVDIDGDLGPNVGTKAQTIATLYGGSATAWAAHDPLTVMARHGHYRDVTGRFVNGSNEHLLIKESKQLAAACHKVAIPAEVVVQHGSHVWQFAENVFARTLPWLSAQLDLS
ncbi:S-formylglutathione hydrolase FrmB [Kribbella voronezhensis]|uniref:S-formylglutathione hydrolase FrmB n=1 Tax=Kribbella voronezhensis TaxID=2512212 RepID=A0A4R7T088_9ACTN|nr:alpha/beta hydrolase-fold protein [Kribbella voronezhensis]TDU84228.1 S-formylglutathione hydrolase FrmB [Kribbella voronezhensis]